MRILSSQNVNMFTLKSFHCLSSSYCLSTTHVSFSITQISQYCHHAISTFRCFTSLFVAFNSFTDLLRIFYKRSKPNWCCLLSYTIRYIPHKACCLIVSSSSLISCSDPLITRIALISQHNWACTAAISNTVFACFFNFRSACSTHFPKSRIQFPYITYYYFRVSTTRD